jgi:hypothetical protein
MKTYGRTRGTCPKHGVVNFLIYALTDDEETIKMCERCKQEAEDFLLQDAS